MSSLDSTDAGRTNVAPPATGTRHTLPFELLDPQSFERLCLWLASEEGFERAEHYGSTGSDGGRDVVAYRPTSQGDDLWYFQCKRVARLTSKELVAELTKAIEHADTLHRSPEGIVFVASCTIPARTRDTVEAKAAENNLSCQFWARTELDRLVKNHPRIMEEFFQLPAGQTLRDRARHLLEAGALDGERGDHAEAHLDQLEEAVRLAIEISDRELERGARRTTARALGEFVVAERLAAPRRASILARVEMHLDALRGLGEKPHRLAIERALAARLGDDPQETMALAEDALLASKSDGDISDLADALVAYLQACWQLDRVQEALEQEHAVKDVLRARPHEDAYFVLWATWLGTLCRAGQPASSMLSNFHEEVRCAVEDGVWGRNRAAQILGQLAADFARFGLFEQTLQLYEWGYALVAIDGVAGQCMSVALQAADAAAELANEETVRKYLDLADSWGRNVRGDPTLEFDPEHVTARVICLFVRGRAILRLDGHIGVAGGLAHEAKQALTDALSLAIDHRLDINGDTDLFIADLHRWFGDAAARAGDLTEAINSYRAVRLSPAMRHPQFGKDVGVQVWFKESELLVAMGRLDEASSVLAALGKDPRSAGVAQLKELEHYLEDRLRPIPAWFESAEALAIADKARLGLRAAIADQTSFLVEWWREWQGDGQSPTSEILDFWGRGGFARVAAAIRARPHEAIAVDAHSVDEIRQLVRLLCPLFDTVVIKWKGTLCQGLVITPVRGDHGGPGSFGGHGYLVAAGITVRNNWSPAMTWANPLPLELTTFLAGEAIDLIAAGRMIVLPAPLVGCTQTATGWTDELLVDGFLGGPVNAVQDQAGVRAPPSPGARILSLTTHSLPYVRDVSLRDLARVLDDCDEWLRPLRGRIFEFLGSDKLRTERWETRAVIEGAVEEASRQMEEGFNRTVNGRWPVAHGSAAIVLGLSETHQAPDQHEPVTDVLRSLVGEHRDLGPWVPFWALGAVGGRLDWSCPLDNPSHPDPKGEAAETLQSWLFPGTAGWFAPTVIG